LKRFIKEERKMHPNDDLLRALVDREMTDSQAQATQAHLNGCPACRERFARLQSTAERAQARMNAMTPAPGEKTRSPHLAYSRIIRNSRFTKERKESISMFTRRPLWTAVAVIAMLALVFTLTPASAWASSFLGLFRVQNITVIQFDPEAMQRSGDNLEDNKEMVQMIFQENLEITEGGETQPVDSLDAAAAAAGFTPRLPSALGEAQFAVQPGMRAELTIDHERMQALLDAAEVDFRLPGSVDGEMVIVEMQDAVLAGYGCQPEARDASASADCILLVQLPSPTVEAPEGLEPQRVGEAMLKFLGMSASEARALSQRIDWTTTLILPIPQGEGIRYQDVQVDGVTGSLIEEEDSDKYMLLWVRDGFLYGLSGSGSASEALNIAGTLQ
jgi:hypothetical protein